MPESISLISNDEITHDEFILFLKQLGVYLYPDQIYDGRVSRNNCHVWIVLDNSEIQNFAESEIKLITEKLGDYPKTHILLDISKNPGGLELAWEFVNQFYQQWSCVIYDSNNQIYSPPILHQLC
ncbi:hypothetical protein [Crocosphaera sp. XPORK-15E]|uniref:hypothetical protein n=1 Tax=Crocosphaera sp. XPORK-15E TaxID=3110247 RepID=UPI002B20AEA0|nr:hypothetical protein [Crocosphaera sp. XPORK-15E]MEA5537398.1 hypothetical protein [Crocosphaera sp. XPORK-15E]